MKKKPASSPTRHGFDRKAHASLVVYNCIWLRGFVPKRLQKQIRKLGKQWWPAFGATRMDQLIISGSSGSTAAAITQGRLTEFASLMMASAEKRGGTPVGSRSILQRRNSLVAVLKKPDASVAQLASKIDTLYNFPA